MSCILPETPRFMYSYSVKVEEVHVHVWMCPQCMLSHVSLY